MQAEEQQETTEQPSSQPIAEEKSRTSTTANYSSAGGGRFKFVTFALLALSHFLRPTSSQALLPAIQPPISFSAMDPQLQQKPSYQSLLANPTLDAISFWKAAIALDEPRLLNSEILTYINSLEGAVGERGFNTHFFESVTKNKPQVLKWLMDNTEFDINMKEPGLSNTLVHVSIYQSSKDCFDILMAELACDVHVSNNHGETLLFVAAHQPDPHYVKSLLEKGANPNVPLKASGVTPLMIATVSGHMENVVLLAKYGADPGIKDRSGETALGYAVLKRGLRDPITGYLGTLGREMYEGKSTPGEEEESNVYAMRLWGLLGVLLGTVAFWSITDGWYGDLRQRERGDEKEAKEVKSLRRVQIPTKEEKYKSKKLAKEEQEFSKLQKKIVSLQQSPDSGIRTKAGQILDDYSPQTDSLKTLAKQVRDLENLALIQKKEIESNLKNYEKQKLLLEQLTEEIEKLKIAYPIYEEGDDRTKIEKDLKTAVLLSEKCEQLRENLNKTINKNSYAITDQDCSGFDYVLRPLTTIINEHAPLLQFIPKVIDCKKSCDNLLQKLQGSSERIKEDKKKSQATSNFFFEAGFLGQWKEAIRRAGISKQQVSGQKLLKLTERISKAERHAQVLQERIKQLRVFQDEIAFPLKITPIRMQKIKTEIQEIEKVIEYEKPQLQEFQNSLPEQKNPPSLNREKNQKNPSTSQSQFKQSQVFFSKPGESKDAEAKKKKEPLPEVAVTVSMAEDMLGEKEAKSDSITLSYYRHVAIIYVSLKNILKMEELPQHFEDESDHLAWKKIQNIYDNLTENPGILRQYPSPEAAKAASEELVKMIRKLSEGEKISEAFNTHESKLLQKLMTNTKPVTGKPPHTSAKIPEPSSAKTPSHIIALKYLDKHIFKQEANTSVTLTTSTISCS